MRCGFHQISPVTQDGKRVRRSASFVNRQPLVVFHKQGKRLSGDCKHDWASLLTLYDRGPVVELDNHDWAWTQQPAMNFNCHAMAIGSQVGLTPQDWLEGIASPATLDQNPTELILDRYYDLIQSTSSIAATDLSLIEENDVFACYNDRASHFVHSGFVRTVDGELFAISKFGEGPVLLTTVELIETFYAGKFNEIRWYRFNEDYVVKDDSAPASAPRQPR